MHEINIDAGDVAALLIFIGLIVIAVWGGKIAKDYEELDETERWLDNGRG